MGKNYNIAPSRWDFVTLPEEDRATAIGNIYNKYLVKIARVVPEISSRSDRQTHTHRRTHYNTSQLPPLAK